MSTPIPMNALFSLHPKVKMWVQSKNGSTTPADIRCNNQSKPYWFHCDVCNHDFDSILRSIVLAKGNGCGYCYNLRRCPAEVDCKFCFNHSFASHPKAKFWSEKNTITPRELPLNSNAKFWFLCDRGHESQMKLNNIVSGNKWCLKCGHITTTQKQTTPVEKFIKDAKEKYGSKFTYNADEYINLDTKITITCPDHGSYTQCPSDHLRSEGCPECGRLKGILSRTYSKEEYIAKCIIKHNNKYDYSLMLEYTNQMTKIKIKCPTHGEFMCQANHHLWGVGCPPCGIISRTEKWKLTTEEVIARAKIVHGDTYIYDEFLYTTHHGHATIICRVHGRFTQDPWNHLSGTGCKRCTAIYNTEDFIKKAKEIHTIVYDYSRVDYKNSHAKVIIGCSECGFFEQAPNSHLCGSGCPLCINKTQQKLLLWLKKYYEVIPEFKQPWCMRESTGKELRFDFLIKELNIIIELDGGQHFKQVRNWLSPEQQIRIDVYKMQQANKNGYTVIRLLQSDVYKNPIAWLEGQLKAELHIYDEPVNLVIYDKAKNGDIYSRHLALLKEPELDLEDVTDSELSED
jgi:very-short-patch-repair endonuclease